MKQLVGLADSIRKRKLTDAYYPLAFHAKLHKCEIKPLEEILGVGSNEPTFDPKTEAELEKRALRNLAQRKAMRNV